MSLKELDRLYNIKLGTKSFLKPKYYYACNTVFIEDEIVALRFASLTSEGYIDVPINFFPKNILTIDEDYHLTLNPFFDHDISINDISLLVQAYRDLPKCNIKTDWSDPDMFTVFYPNMCYRLEDNLHYSATKMAEVSSLIYDTDFIQTFGVKTIKNFIFKDNVVTVIAELHPHYLYLKDGYMENMLEKWTKKHGVPNGVIKIQNDSLFINMDIGMNLDKIQTKDVDSYSLRGDEWSNIFSEKALTIDDNCIVTIHGDTGCNANMYPYCLFKKCPMVNSMTFHSEPAILPLVQYDFETAMIGYQKTNNNDLFAFLKFGPIIHPAQLYTIDMIRTSFACSSYMEEIAAENKDAVCTHEIHPSFSSIKYVHRFPVDMNAFGEENKVKLLECIQEELDNLTSVCSFMNTPYNCVANVSANGYDNMIILALIVKEKI